LENAVERAFVLSGGNVIEDTDLPPEIMMPSISHTANKGSRSFSEKMQISIPPEGLDLDTCLHELEKACCEEAIRRKNGNREAAARLLGIKPHTFRKRMKGKFRM